MGGPEDIKKSDEEKEKQKEDDASSNNEKGEKDDASASGKKHDAGTRVRKRKRKTKHTGKTGDPEVESTRDKVAAKIRDIYSRHNPSKLSEIEAMMKKYTGAEREVYVAICRKYSEEPDAELAKGIDEAASLSPLKKRKADSPVKVTAPQKVFAKKASMPAPPESLSGKGNVKTSAAGKVPSGSNGLWPFNNMFWEDNESSPDS